MPYKDVREFISRLEKEGEAIRIEEEVDWNLEAGAMLRRSNEEGLPAPFFQKIKDYPKGYRLFGGGAANFKRLAIALDANPKIPPKELIEELLRRKSRRIKPVIVKDAPCKENVYVGDKADVLKLPVPMVHEGDGGRYVGTWHLSVCKDIENEWVNWGMYRHMVHDGKTIGVLQGTVRSHLGQILEHYESRGKTMEVAIVIGAEPVSAICAASSIAYGTTEAEVAGGLRGAPIELVKCETVDLEVPATAEIVIEGVMNPGERRDEGPFGEFTGYVGAPRAPRPVIHITAITHRNEPILTMSCMGIAVDDNCVIALTKSAAMLEELRAKGLPVTGVNIFPESGYLCAVVATRNLYGGVAGDIAHAIWGMGAAGGHETPYIIVVEDDVDPFNLSQVFHALVTKCHPFRGIHRLDRAAELSLIPWLSRQEQLSGMGAKIYFDCTWPVEWSRADVPRRSSFKTIYPPEIQEKVVDRWRQYGY